MLAKQSLLSPLSAEEEISVPLSLGRCLTIAFVWCALLALLAVALSAIFPATGQISQSAFANWDAKHYLYIRLNGYDMRRTAFFPMFPFLWRWLNVSAIAMGLINLSLFAGGFATLAWQFRWSLRQQLLLLAVPSLVFMALPYTEAVFFIGGTLVLVGLRRQMPALYWLGLVLSCVTRSAAFVLLPTVIVTAVITREPGRRLGSELTAAAATVVGLAISVVVHYWYTGRWFVFFDAMKLWKNELRPFSLPLTNWGGTFPTRFEAPALLVGIACVVGLSWLTLRHWRHTLPAAVRPEVFALAYVAGITLVTLATQGGGLVSFSRYVYATPYFLLLLACFTSRIRLSNRQLLWLFGCMEISWLVLFAAYGHIRTFLGFTFVSFCVILWLTNAHRHALVRRYALLPTVASGVILMMVMLFRFLRNEWVA